MRWWGCRPPTATASARARLHFCLGANLARTETRVALKSAAGALPEPAPGHLDLGYERPGAWAIRVRSCPLPGR